MTPDEDSAAIFAEYHRRERSRSTRHAFLLVVAAGFGAGLVGLLASGPTSPSAGQPGSPTVGAPATAEPGPSGTVVPAALPSPPPTDIGDPVPAAPVTDGPWRIAVAATGYQAELDACQWVRMDLGVAPIVGAHRSCGGAIVLEMADLDVVEIAGQGLDGSYRVTAARDAHAGDAAASATEGLEADVILQTCYPGSDGRVRLVALIRVDSSDAAAAPAAAPAA